MTTTLTSRPHPLAYPHGEIEPIFEDIYFVKGTVNMKDAMPCHLSACFSRNMVIIRQGKDLILVNTVRLDEDGLKELEKLGTVKHVIRLGAFHGMDDPFYKERYGAYVWAVEGTRYFTGFDVKSEECYFEPDKYMNSDTVLPIKNSNLIVIASANPPEGLLLLERPEGKVLITGDTLQNYKAPDRFFNCLGRIMMTLMGFIVPFNVGPAWYSTTKADKAEVAELLNTKFDFVLPTHGDPVVGQAWKKYEPAIQKLK